MIPTHCKTRPALVIAVLTCFMAASSPGCARPKIAEHGSVLPGGPRDAGGYVGRAQRLREHGLHQVALAELERAIAINPMLTTAYLSQGDVYRETGDYVRAEVSYSRAADLDPRNFDAQYLHGLTLQLLNRLADAVGAYLRALSIRPDDYSANLNIATAYLQLGEPAQALPYARRAVRLRGDDGTARVNLGAVYAALGDHRSAVVEYQQAAELMELNPQLLLNLADSLGQIGRLPEMQNTLEQLIRSAPSAVAYERLGSVLFRLGRYDESLTAFRKALEHDPDYYPALNGVGVCLLNRYLVSDKQDEASREEALRHLRRSLQVERRQPKVLELVSRYG
jgi:tetratricopeptide (TPR) repeat protein